MLSNSRLRIENEESLFQPVGDFSVFDGFFCGDSDLDAFIKEDAEPHHNELFAVTYSYHLKDQGAVSEPVAFVSLSNDAIANFTKSQKRRIIPHKKRHYPVYPAVKIGRLAVALPYQGLGVGTHLLLTLKTLFTTNNRSGCRFMTVDAYRNATSFYINNDFDYIISADRLSTEPTIPMYTDLLRFKREMQR